MPSSDPIKKAAHQKKANANFRRNHPERVKAAQAAWYQENREHSIEKNRRWRAAHPNADIEGHLKRKYGMTVADYDAMLVAQDGGCAICGGQPNGRWKHKFHVDHDHATGKVRGLLCHRCNMMVGYSLDRPEILDHAAIYLRKQ